MFVNKSASKRIFRYVLATVTSGILALFIASLMPIWKEWRTYPIGTYINYLSLWRVSSDVYKTKPWDPNWFENGSPMPEKVTVDRRQHLAIAEKAIGIGCFLGFCIYAFVRMVCCKRIKIS